MRRLTTILTLLLLTSAGVVASADDSTQARAERAKLLVASWSWPADGASAAKALEAAKKAGPDHELKLEGTRLTVRADGGARWTLDLEHAACDFRVVGGLLIVARYHRMSTGCSLEAYALAGGAKRWTSHLRGLGPIDHSKYWNRTAVMLQGGLLIVRGEESMGTYTEVVEPATGKTIAHKRH